MQTAFSRRTVLFFVLATAASANACIWDRDTVRVELVYPFPEAIELISGTFPQHSPALYEWRVRDRRKQIEEDPSNLAAYDDLGVALDKLGRSEEAIAVMQRKEEISPNLYETAANLGTFQIHSGRFQEGLRHIRRAIQINPDAHFGREIWQQRLVEYVLTRRDASGEIPIPLRSTPWDRGFEDFVWSLSSGDSEALDSATRGVLGMLRFGQNDSPILLEVAGDLLSAGQGTIEGIHGDAQSLSGWAYLRASRLVEDEGARLAYREFALHTIDSGEVSLRIVEAALDRQLAKADALNRQVAEDESRWIASGIDPDAEFDAKYLPLEDANRYEAVLYGTAIAWVLAFASLVVFRILRQRKPREHDLASVNR